MLSAFYAFHLRVFWACHIFRQLLADEGVEKLKAELKEENAKREGEIQHLAKELSDNKGRQAKLQEELQQLRHKERVLEDGMAKHKLEQKRAAEVGWINQ